MARPKQILIELFVAIALLFALDAALFRTSWYRARLEPESYAGRTELMIRRAASASGPRAILVLGDSRIAEGFSSRIANQASAGRFTFVNGSVSGSSLRAWHYLLRAADPDANRFHAIVVPFDDYHDEDGVEDWADRTLDLRIVLFCLHLRDIWDFTSSVRHAGERFDILRGITFKGFEAKADVQQFLLHPLTRSEKARQWAESGAEWINSYEGHSGSMSDAPIPPARTMVVQNGCYAAYRRLWLGRILSRYESTPTRVWIIRVPRTPYPAQQPPEPPSSVIREIQSAALRIEDENTFLPLESPEYFFDALHLNVKGRQAFSKGLAELPF